jgi:hypothetical protein
MADNTSNLKPMEYFEGIGGSCFVFGRFRFVVLPSSTYLFTAGVEVVYFHLVTLRHTPQSVGLLWTRDRLVAETST